MLCNKLRLLCILLVILPGNMSFHVSPFCTFLVVRHLASCRNCSVCPSSYVKVKKRTNEPNQYIYNLSCLFQLYVSYSCAVCHSAEQ
uniref:Putative secreted protein n=1 Tax=Rhipicephalus microplus TaxID=6941 RepID=A0A6G5A2N9_RHIMP